VDDSGPITETEIREFVSSLDGDEWRHHLRL
jgi:hypothetical protein